MTILTILFEAVWAFVNNVAFVVIYPIATIDAVAVIKSTANLASVWCVAGKSLNIAHTICARRLAAVDTVTFQEAVVAVNIFAMVALEFVAYFANPFVAFGAPLYAVAFDATTESAGACEAAAVEAKRTVALIAHLKVSAVAFGNPLFTAVLLTEIALCASIGTSHNIESGDILENVAELSAARIALDVVVDQSASV